MTMNSLALYYTKTPMEEQSNCKSGNCGKIKQMDFIYLYKTFHLDAVLKYEL